MHHYIMAEQNERLISGEDKIFGVNQKAQEMIKTAGKDKVVNATVGSLLDESGNLVILSSVAKILHELSPVDFAEYAPIAGTPAYLEAVKEAVFMGTVPKEASTVIATPGGTGAIRSAIQNYSKKGDAIMTSDWYWSPYKIIAGEIERRVETYPIFDENNQFNDSAFAEKMQELLTGQDRLLIIINTPAHNPTGYSLTLEDWDHVISSVKEAAKDRTKKIVLLVDVAYLDFAGDAMEYRAFMPKLLGLPDNILPLFAFSMSKSFTVYGMRGGALICLSENEAIAEEFKIVSNYSGRATWSNNNRSAMVALSRIFKDPVLLEDVVRERSEALAMLQRRGKIFTKAAAEIGLSICPYDSGFFTIVNCANPDAVGEELYKDGIFAVPFNNSGLRLSIASISEEWCSQIPKKIMAAIARAEAK